MKFSDSGLDAMLLSHFSNPWVDFHLKDIVAVVVGKDLHTATKIAWISDGVAPQHIQFRTTRNLHRLRMCLHTL